MYIFSQHTASKIGILYGATSSGSLLNKMMLKQTRSHELTRTAGSAGVRVGPVAMYFCPFQI